MTRRALLRVRAGLLLLVAALCAGLTAPLSASGAPRLYVFVTADMRANALQKQIEAHLPGVEVTVFGRVRGFEAALRDRPEAVLAQRPVLEAMGMRAELQGYRGKSAEETYLIVSSGKSLSASDLEGKTVGAVNILGRRYMNSFMQELLGGVSPKLKYVTHERDLLALLQFGAVDAVVTSSDWVERFRHKSEMRLSTQPAAKKVGLVAVSFPNGAGGELKDKIKSAGAGLNTALGVTRWQ